jgi:outer membrane protein OmpA-like peptidoglycan-associated protein
LTKVLSNEDTSAASKPIKKFNAENKHTAYTAFSPTSNRVYYTNCVYGNKGDEIVCTIFYREKNDDSFSKEVELPDFINFKGYSNSMPHLAIENGQEILYFVSNRPDGKGKNDIWYSIVLPSGGFSYPVNCASINTREDEMSPYYHVPNKTLYFSSNGYESLGGLDVFASEKNKNIFATPKNMGVPLNSSYNDLYFNLSEGGTEGYLASNRLGSLFLDKKNETCCYDVYKVELGKKVLETPKKETTKPPVTNVSNPPKTTSIPPTTNTNVPKDKPKEYNPPTTNNLPPAQNTTKPPPDNYKPNPSGTKFDIPTNIPKEYGSTPNYTSLEEFLPLPLYFDNDEPDRNTKAISTSKTYEDAFNFYYKRKYEYIEKNLKGSDRATSIKNMDELFEKNIRSNFILLQKFTPILMARLYKGESIEIIIKGFASPLAKNDYNNNLGKRRVASLVNFWKKYEGGLLKKYFDNGQLKVSQVSFGEDTAAQNVSDDQYNEAASIYSVGASKERRIEIIEIKKK